MKKGKIKFLVLLLLMFISLNVNVEAKYKKINPNNYKTYYISSKRVSENYVPKPTSYFLDTHKVSKQQTYKTKKYKNGKIHYRYYQAYLESIGMAQNGGFLTKVRIQGVKTYNKKGKVTKNKYFLYQGNYGGYAKYTYTLSNFKKVGKKKLPYKIVINAIQQEVNGLARYSMPKRYTTLNAKFNKIKYYKNTHVKQYKGTVAQYYYNSKGNMYWANKKKTYTYKSSGLFPGHFDKDMYSRGFIW